MSQKTKRKKNKPHPTPNNNGAGEHQKDCMGNTHVSGEIEVQIGTGTIEKLAAEQNKPTTEKKVKAFREWATLLFVIFTAGFTGVQSCVIHQQQITNAQQLRDFEATQKPIINVEVTNQNFWTDKAGDLQVTASIEISNVGQNAATKLTHRHFMGNGVGRLNLNQTPSYGLISPSPGGITLGPRATPITVPLDFMVGPNEPLQKGEHFATLGISVAYVDPFGNSVELPIMFVYERHHGRYVRLY